jgi:hypothetical protein
VVVATLRITLFVFQKMWTFGTESTSKHCPGYQFQSSFEVTMPHFLKYNVMGGAGLTTNF